MPLAGAVLLKVGSLDHAITITWDVPPSSALDPLNQKPEQEIEPSTFLITSLPADSED